jgi:flagellar biosynthesis GTPase FlhF
MRIKSFFAKSVDEAITQARAELGTEALLLNTRKLAGEAGKAGGYEVVFGLAEEAAEPVLESPQRQSNGDVRPRVGSVAKGAGLETHPDPVAASPVAAAPAATMAPAAAIAPAKMAPAATAGSPGEDDSARELERLHAQMDEIRNLMTRLSRHHFAAARSVPELAEVYDRLISAEVDPALSKSIVDRVEAAMATDAFFERVGAGPQKTDHPSKTSRRDPRRLEALVRAEMARRASVDPRCPARIEDFAAIVFDRPQARAQSVA